MKRNASYVVILCMVLLFWSCDKDDGYTPMEDDDVEQVSPVNFDLAQVPYDNLSEYNFFEGDISDLNAVYGVLPYELITPLFSDYTTKERFIWMPDNVYANYVDDHTPLDFPVGTVLIKNFYYENVQPDNSTLLLETRLMIMKNEGWVFANYRWNDDQTDAVFDLTGKVVAVDFVANGEMKSANYKIPNENECFLCHQSQSLEPVPIGVKPQNLNKNFRYEEGMKNQLAKLVEFGYLDTAPSNIETTVAYDDASQPLDMRVRSYLDINCAHCHSDFGHCSYRPMRFSITETENPFNLGVCIEATQPLVVDDKELFKIIEPGKSDESVLLARMQSNAENIRMPLIGRSIQHKEAVSMIDEWIASLNNDCN